MNTTNLAQPFFSFQFFTSVRVNTVLFNMKVMKSGRAAIQIGKGSKGVTPMTRDAENASSASEKRSDLTREENRIFLCRCRPCIVHYRCSGGDIISVAGLFRGEVNILHDILVRKMSKQFTYLNSTPQVRKKLIHLK